MPLAPQAERALRAIESYYRTSLDVALAATALSVRKAGVLQFVQGVAREVPAYANFLAAQGIRADAVKNWDAFRALPKTTKQNYHQAYPLGALCRFGDLSRCDFLAMSSGSTGAPSAWPRFSADELGTAMRFEQVLHDAFFVHQRKTLGIVCFSLGSWVGGMFTTAACRHVAAKGYPLTLVTPGANIKEILRVVRALGGQFEQVVLFGYPPFLKDVIDAGSADGIEWRKYAIKLVTAGEVFSEQWRALVCERISATDPSLATASLYGTADGGVLANETPLSIQIRRFLEEQPRAAAELFGQARLPTLCQFDPLHRAFEAEEGELIFTGDGGIPLVRYRILDHGGVFEYGDLLARLKDFGFVSKLPSNALREQPFVFVFGRSRFAVSFYGANVYPENVALGLERLEVAPWVTGKFVMGVLETDERDAVLEVVVELASGVEPRDGLAQLAAVGIQRELERVNSEFLNYVPLGKRAPEVRLLPLGTPSHFPPGVKHRYTR